MPDEQEPNVLGRANTDARDSGPKRAPLAPAVATEHAAALQEVSEYLEAILNAIADPVFVKDEDLRFVLVNDSFCDLLEQRREDILGKCDADFFPADEAEVFRDKDREVLTSGEPNLNQETLTDAHGEQHVLATKKSRFTSRSGKRFIVGVIRDVTVLIRNEEALARQAELLELTSDAVIVRDLATNRIVFWNRGAERKYGWSRQEALGQDSHDLLRTGFPEPLAAISRTLASTGTWEGTLRHTARDGHAILVSSRWAVQRGSEGRPGVVLEISRDVTRQKQAEQELIAQRNFIEGLVQNLPVGVAYATPDLIFEWVNPPYAKAFGRSPEAFIGRALFDVFPGTEAQVEALLQEVVRTGRPFSAYSWRFAFEDAEGTHETFWDLTVTPIFEDGHRVKGLLVSASEVTPRVRLEREVAQRNEELERERSFIKRVVDNVPAAIAYLDRDLVFRAVNPAYARMVEIPMGRIMNHEFESVFGATGAAQVRPLLLEVLRSGEAFHATGFPFTYMVEGTERLSHWDFTYQPLFGPHQEVDGVLIMSTEVSARVEGERLQQELIRHLREVDTMKDEFISILSHELRTPINAITGFGSILDDEIAGQLTEEQHVYLGKMLSGADTLLNLVNDLLDMSRIQAGKFHLDPARMEVAPVVASVFEALAPLAEKKHQTLRNEAAGPLPAIVADEQRVRQVLVNLVGNAIKFTPDGGTIHVRTALVGDRVRCEVEDSGIGLSEAEIQRLFKPFTQIDMSPTRQAGGTGLGLSINKALVEAHGGSIGVFSRGPRQGSTFWFALPLIAETSPRSGKA